jgi:hypothetical protein
LARRNLVVCRAGAESLHPRWLGDPASRSWDLLLSAYHDDAPLTGDEILVHRVAGSKWQGLADLMAKHGDVVDSYDRIWFPDDDLDCDQAAIDRMFAYADRFDLALFQPSLTHDSFISWPITLRHKGFVLRYTNFVESMAPGFGRTLLGRVRDIFATTVIGWGLDFLWPRFTELGQTAIIDATAVHHTRPIGGTMKWAGFNTQADRTTAIGLWTARYIPDINWRMAINFGGIRKDGSLLCYAEDNAATDRFMAALEAGIDGVKVKPGRPPEMLTDYIKVHQAFGRARNKVGLFHGIDTVLAEKVAVADAKGISLPSDQNPASTG